jgi:hypothetical protein
MRIPIMAVEFQCLMKNEDADEDRQHNAQFAPDGVGNPERKVFSGLRQEKNESA